MRFSIALGIVAVVLSGFAGYQFKLPRSPQTFPTAEVSTSVSQENAKSRAAIPSNPVEIVSVKRPESREYLFNGCVKNVSKRAEEYFKANISDHKKAAIRLFQKNGNKHCGCLVKNLILIEDKIFKDYPQLQQKFYEVKYSDDVQRTISKKRT